MIAEKRAMRGPASTLLGNMRIEFGAAAWDAVLIEATPPIPLPDNFEGWFNTWLDVEKAPKPGAITAGIIHSVSQEGDALSIDFGTAPPMAALELFNLYRISGAQELRITSGR